MGRQPRLIAEGLVYHALNRGNNREAVFFESGDYWAFLESLRRTKERYLFRLFGYCLMTNHYTWSCSPSRGKTLAAFFNR